VKRKARRVTAPPGVPDRSADATPLACLFLFRRRLHALALSVHALPSSCSFSPFLQCEQIPAALCSASPRRWRSRLLDLAFAARSRSSTSIRCVFVYTRRTRPDPCSIVRDCPLFVIMLDFFSSASLAPCSHSPSTASLLCAPGNACARPHPPHFAHMAHVRELHAAPRTIPICGPAPRSARAASPACASKTTRAPIFSSPSRPDHSYFSALLPAERASARKHPRAREAARVRATTPQRSACARRFLHRPVCARRRPTCTRLVFTATTARSAARPEARAAPGRARTRCTARARLFSAEGV
jgi:hypothetical protein